ncbi:MAG: cupin domain-containing protein [Rhodospirillales bacterium]|nr:cupin domain-containing protein [Rhodospirillales bacterium]
MNIQGQAHQAAEAAAKTDFMNVNTDNVAWTEICPGAFVKVLSVDENTNCVDTLVKFEPNFSFNRHRHLSQAVAYVIKGEIRDVVSGEVCGQGTWINDPAGTVHQEAAGSEGFVLYAGLRSDTPKLVEVLDDDDNVIQEVTVADYKAIYDNQ